MRCLPGRGYLCARGYATVTAAVKSHCNFAPRQSLSAPARGSWRYGKVHEARTLSCTRMVAADRRARHHADADPHPVHRHRAVSRRLRDPFATFQGFPPFPSIYAPPLRVVLAPDRERRPSHADDGEAHASPHEPAGACPPEPHAQEQERVMAIPFIRAFEVQYETLVRVSPLISRVVADNPGPFTFKGTGVYIVGGDEVAVIDPGPDDASHVDALKRALAGKRVTHILVTHTHSDHSPAAK